MRALLCCFCFLLFGAGGAAASDLASFNEAMARAYGPYREAAFYLRTGNVGAGALALDQAIANWDALSTRFAETPPDAYRDDATWTDTLQAVSRDLAHAMAAVDAGDSEAATDALAPIRPRLADLRRRNGQWIYSDCIDEMNAQMDLLWVYRHQPPDFASPAAVNRLKKRLAVVAYWYVRCRDRAPAGHRAAADFDRQFDGGIASLDLLWSVIDEGDLPRFINILRELRSFDRLIYLRFG